MGLLVCQLLAWGMFRRIVKNILLILRILRWELLSVFCKTRNAHFTSRCFNRAIFLLEMKTFLLILGISMRILFSPRIENLLYRNAFRNVLWNTLRNVSDNGSKIFGGNVSSLQKCFGECFKECLTISSENL